MVGAIINLIQQDKYRKVSEAVDLAKGKNELPETWGDLPNYITRNTTRYEPGASN